MSNPYLSSLLIGAAALASSAWLSSIGHAADLYIHTQPAPCRTVFTALPVPPHFTRNGCIVNVITVHRLPRRRESNAVVWEHSADRSAGGGIYRSNLAFDLTQKAYVTDRVVQATVASASRPSGRNR